MISVRCDTEGGIKAGKLEEDEFEIIKSHTIKGYQLLKDLPVDITVKYSALMHHERCDGSGYPNGFVANQIEKHAKIIAIADVYDAMTSNRCYREAFCPFDVVENFELEDANRSSIYDFLERLVNPMCTILSD